MMDDYARSLQQAFLEEAQELLAELESSVMELETSPGDPEVIGRVFRALHTIKGNGAMFGFEAVSAFTHDVENVFQMLREGRLAASKELIDLTLEAKDVIHRLLGQSAETADGGPQAAGILRRLRRLAGIDERAAGRGTAHPAIPGESTYRIRFRPSPGLLANGTNPLALLRELRLLGETRVVAHLEDIPDLAGLDPERCYVSWDVVLTTDRDLNAVRDVFIFVEDLSKVEIETVMAAGEGGDEGEPRLGEILVRRGDIRPEDLQRVLEERPLLGEELTARKMVSRSGIEAALAEQQAVKGRRVEKGEETLSSIRVAAEKLDDLVNLVGEMVTVQSRLTRTAALRGDSELVAIAEEVERLTWELRDNSFAIRMVPIGTTFGKFRRLVRDLSRETGKELDLLTEGGDTELDKTVIEKLNDPLVHLMRNSIDHGIEPPEARQAAGKSRRGTITLSAHQAGANVVIRIADDGGGLDVEAIRRKAVEGGLISRDAELSDRDLGQLLFAPGFSTARTVTSVSGRGVGLDVVRRSVESLQGSVEVESAHGRGTTFVIRLPLTLAIIEGLQVALGEERFVLPVSLVDECIELHCGDAVSERRHLANVRGEIIPYVRLREWFGIPGETPVIQQIVITRTDGIRVGLVVDFVVGEHQTVIKTLGRVYRDVPGVSGATILGDGNVALILDVPGLVKAFEQAEGRRIEGA